MHTKSAVAALAFAILAVPALAQQSSMTFFVTSANPGKGADLGGLEGADRFCQQLATAVGAGGKTWRAYLSSQGASAVNAKDRIGKGPWQNAKGVVVAKDVADLHGASNNLNKQTGTDGKRRRRERTRRPAERARRAHRNAARRHGLCDKRRQDVRELDEGRRRLRGGWPSRPHGSRHEPAARCRGTRRIGSTRLRHRRAARHGRGRLLLLLRRELRDETAPTLAGTRPPRGRTVRRGGSSD